MMLLGKGAGSKGKAERYTHRLACMVGLKRYSSTYHTKADKRKPSPRHPHDGREYNTGGGLLNRKRAPHGQAHKHQTNEDGDKFVDLGEACTLRTSRRNGRCMNSRDTQVIVSGGSGHLVTYEVRLCLDAAVKSRR